MGHILSAPEKSWLRTAQGVVNKLKEAGHHVTKISSWDAPGTHTHVEHFGG